MCRNIRTLFNFDPPATDAEINAAATQYVRKLSGYNSPSRANQLAFDQAISEISSISKNLLETLTTRAPAKSRELEREKALLRSAARFPGR